MSWGEWWPTTPSGLLIGLMFSHHGSGCVLLQRLVEYENGSHSRKQPRELHKTLLQTGIVVQDRREIYHPHIQKTRRRDRQEEWSARCDKREREVSDECAGDRN